MYGKSFMRMYQGSMVGSGSHVFAVWGYCITNADAESHTVDLNPVLLSAILGESVDLVQKAIDFLCSPDPKSHCPDHGGARMIHRGGYEYFLVTHEDYRNMQNNEELREYFREAKRKQREKESGLSKTVKDNLGQSQDSVSASGSDSSLNGEYEGDFVEFWKAYPRKVGKIAAFKAWQKATSRPPIADILAAVLKQSAADQWRKEGGQFIPHPSTWLNQGRWADEPTTSVAPAEQKLRYVR